MFNGAITHVLSSRDNNKIYRIKYEDDNEENFAFQELNAFVHKKRRKDNC